MREKNTLRKRDDLLNWKNERITSTLFIAVLLLSTLRTFNDETETLRRPHKCLALRDAQLVRVPQQILSYCLRVGGSLVR